MHTKTYNRHYSKMKTKILLSIDHVILTDENSYINIIILLMTKQKKYVILFQLN